MSIFIPHRSVLFFCKITFISFAFFTGSVSMAQIEQSDYEDEKIYSANLVVTEKRYVGSDIEVITEDEIEKMQALDVSAVLSKIAGVNVSSTGANGPSNVFIRGAKSSHTLVLIDGVVVNDPMSPERSFDFSTLKLTNIARIEVLKGSQSTLYGSNAVGGVVQIFTKKGTVPRTSVDFEIGSFRSLNTTLSHSGSTDRWTYSFSASADYSDSISTAGEIYGNREKDGEKNQSVSTAIGFNVSDDLSFDATLRYINDKQDYDAHGGVNGDDAYLRADTIQLIGKFAANLWSFDDHLESILSYEISEITRKSHNDPDEYSMDFMRSRYYGRQETFLLQNTWDWDNGNTTIFGLSHQEETGNSYYSSDGAYGPYFSEFPKEKQMTNSVFVEQALNFSDRWFNTIGARIDHYDEYGTVATYRLTSRYQFSSNWSIRGSVGTGYNAPSLYQLYDPISGNLDLAPEESISYDLGIMWDASERSSFEMGLFLNDYEHMIDYLSAQSKYYNVSKARTKGVELKWDYDINDHLQSKVAYTYLWAKDLESNEALLYRPKHSVHASLDYQVNEKINVYGDVSYFSSSEGYGGVRMAPYTLVNVAFSYQYSDQVQLRASVNNLFDEFYETREGYAQAGINAYIGVSVDF